MMLSDEPYCNKHKRHWVGHCQGCRDEREVALAKHAFPEHELPAKFDSTILPDGTKGFYQSMRLVRSWAAISLEDATEVIIIRVVLFNKKKGLIYVELPAETFPVKSCRILLIEKGA